VSKKARRKKTVLEMMKNLYKIEPPEKMNEKKNVRFILAGLHSSSLSRGQSSWYVIKTGTTTDFVTGEIFYRIENLDRELFDVHLIDKNESSKELQKYVAVMKPPIIRATNIVSFFEQIDRAEKDNLPRGFCSAEELDDYSYPYTDEQYKRWGDNVARKSVSYNYEDIFGYVEIGTKIKSKINKTKVEGEQIKCVQSSVY